MLIKEDFQFGQNFYVEWHRYYYLKGLKILPFLLVSTGHIHLSNAALNYEQDWAKQEDPNIIKQWFKTVHETIQEHGIHEGEFYF